MCGNASAILDSIERLNHVVLKAIRSNGENEIFPFLWNFPLIFKCEKLAD